MRNKPLTAALLSTFIPGLGQIVLGKGERGAAILIATIMIGNLNAIWLTLYAQPVAITDPFWGQQLPRILHDVLAFYGLAFLIWQVWDASQLARQSRIGSSAI